MIDIDLFRLLMSEKLHVSKSSVLIVIPELMYFNLASDTVNTIIINKDGNQWKLNKNYVFKKTKNKYKILK